jgi:hypothetical protein
MHKHPPDHQDPPRRLDWSQPQPSNGAIYRGAGLTVRAYTAEELRARLDPSAPAGPALLDDRFRIGVRVSSSDK